MKHFAYQLGLTYNKQNSKWFEMEVVSNINDHQRDELQAFITKRGLDVKTICEHFGIDALTQIESSKLDTVKQEIDKYVREVNAA